MELVVGIDGGGTKTAVVIADLEGNEIASKKFGPSNINSIGVDAFCNLMEEISDYINGFGLCRSLCLGISGVSNKTMVDSVDKVFSAAGIDNYSLVGDHIIALEGAHEGKSGIAVIAGTGSICFGKDLDGRIERTGGWGHLIGDSGSAYGIGRDIFSFCAKAMDGYGEKTILTQLLSSEFNLDSREEIIGYVYGSDKSKVAAVSRLVDIAYKQNDPVAIEIVRRNAEDLAFATDGVAKKLSLDSSDVALFGGMIEKDTPFRSEFSKALSRINKNLNCIHPKRNASQGAVMIALKNLIKGVEK